MQEKDKIASSVTTYTLKGDEVYYIEDDGDFAKYHLENRQEKRLQVMLNISTFSTKMNMFM